MCSPLPMSTPWIARAGNSPRRAGEIEPDDTVSGPVASTEASSPASEGAASDGASGRGAAAPPEPEQPAEVTTPTTGAATRRRRRQARTIVPKPGLVSAERIWDRPDRPLGRVCSAQASFGRSVALGALSDGAPRNGEKSAALYQSGG